MFDLYNNQESNEKNLIKLEQSSKGVSKYHLLASSIQALSAVILGVILWFLYLYFGGEFVILAENIWILVVFGCLIVVGAFYNLIIVILSVKSGCWRGMKIKRLDESNFWQVGWSIWNFLIGMVLIVLFIILYVLIADLLKTMGLSFLGFVLGIPFVGLGALFVLSSLRVFLGKIRKLKDVQILSGLTAAGIAFLFLISSVGLVLLFYNPQWTPGVEHQALFTSDEQPGRGYRIPTMLVLPNNTILAFCESRADPMLDWGDIDLVMKRSTDGGETWSNIIILRDEGTHTAGNPCPVYDNITNTVWLPYCVDNKLVFVMNSTDLGLSWSVPREITDELQLNLSGSTDQQMLEYGTGPGIGIQLKSGRLVIPCYYFDERGSHVIYSDDNGSSWHKGANLGKGSECQVLEAVDGTICLNARPRPPGQYRVIAWSSDSGETWGPWSIDYELPDPRCMASIIRFTDNTTHLRNRILFSNPDEFSRGHMTIRMSYDEGSTWNVSKLVYEGPSAYSQLAILSNYTIGLLFEQGRLDYRESIQFARVDLEWLVNGQDHFIPK